MGMLDIENDDAFSVTTLTAKINEKKEIPGKINNSGLFSEEGITTTMVEIEKDGDTLSLVPAQERGAPPDVVNGSKRNLIPFTALHLPQRSTIKADSVQNVRAFGEESAKQMLQDVVVKRGQKLARRNDATIEHLKVGAIKGQILDADGSTVLLDVYQRFGISQQTFAMGINTASTKMNDKCRELMDFAEDQMDNVAFEGAHVYCGRNFYNKFAGHSKVEEAFDRWNSGAFMREGTKRPFDFCDITFEKYRGGIGNYRFIPDDVAYLVLTGVEDLFITRYAPGDYNDVVNTEGVPYYASIETLGHNKGFELEVQSNPICICTNPKAVIKLTMGS